MSQLGLKMGSPLHTFIFCFSQDFPTAAFIWPEVMHIKLKIWNFSLLVFQLLLESRAWSVMRVSGLWCSCLTLG